MKRAAEAGTEPESQELGPAMEFLRVLWSVNHGLESLSKRMQRTLGVSGRERIILRVIGSRPGGSAGDASAVLHIDPSTLTGVLGRLVARGLVRRTTHPEDARRAVLSLTSRGRAVDGLKRGTIEARVGEALRRYDERDVRAAALVLFGVASALEE